MGRSGRLVENIHRHPATANACTVKFRIARLDDVAARRTHVFAAGVGLHATESVSRDAVGAMDFDVRFHNVAVLQRVCQAAVAGITDACDGCHALTVPGSQIPGRCPPRAAKIALEAFIEKSDAAHRRYFATQLT
jgi:hypothetical protein